MPFDPYKNILLPSQQTPQGPQLPWLPVQEDSGMDNTMAAGGNALATALQRHFSQPSAPHPAVPNEFAAPSAAHFTQGINPASALQLGNRPNQFSSLRWGR